METVLKPTRIFRVTEAQNYILYVLSSRLAEKLVIPRTSPPRCHPLSKAHLVCFQMLALFFFQCFRALCCKGPPPPRPEYDVVCIGLTGAGKTSLLSRLCSEGCDGIVPTTGKSMQYRSLGVFSCTLCSDFCLCCD